MPYKRRIVPSKVCFSSEKAGLLDHSYNKCYLRLTKNRFFTVLKANMKPKSDFLNRIYNSLIDHL